MASVLLEELHDHTNVLASIRDQIEGIAPALETPRLRTRAETNRYVTYSDFLDKAQQTIHNYGAGLASVRNSLRSYKAAIDREVRLHFMLLNPDIVTDATARFFSEHQRADICSEIHEALKVHLTQLSDYTKSNWPQDYYKRMLVRWRETGPDIGILARDLDTPNGVMRVEFYSYDINSDQWRGLLLYPNQELYRVFRDVIHRLWEDSDQSVTGVVTSSDKPGQILLTLRSTELEQFGGMWCLPGGHVDVGEYNIEAIVREVREETGLEFDPHYFDQFEENYPEYQHHVWVNAYVGDVIGGNPNRQEAEVTQMQWFALDEACEMALAFGHEKILRAYRDREKLYRLESRWIRR
jgi:mutator protein MutT